MIQIRVTLTVSAIALVLTAMPSSGWYYRPYSITRKPWMPFPSPQPVMAYWTPQSVLKRPWMPFPMPQSVLRKPWMPSFLSSSVGYNQGSFPNHRYVDGAIELLTTRTHEEGLTKEVSLTCRLKQQSGDIISPTHLTIFKAELGDKYLAHLITPNDLKVHNNMGADVSGSDSILTMKWTYPTNETAGEYICLAYGLDLDERLLRSDASVIVPEISYDIDSLLKHMKNFTDKLDEQESKSDVCNANLDEKESIIKWLTDNTFDKRFSHNGHEYLLSKMTVEWNVHHYQNICRAHAGHLVEINNREEYDAIKAFLDKVKLTSGVAVGAIRNTSTSPWRFMDSGGEMTYFNWVPKYPSDDINKRCMIVSRINILMWNYVCESSHYHYHFLCEMP